MKILNHNNNYTINSLAKAIQDLCNTLVSSPEQYQIKHLEDLNRQLQDYTKNISQTYRKSKPDNFTGEVHSYKTFEVYSLLYKENVLLISIVARKTEYEAAFAKYDSLGNSKRVLIG